jgi:flagellar biosynthesis protein FliQ
VAGTDVPAMPEGARRTGPLDWLTGQGARSGAAGENLTATAGRLARDNVLETVAILSLGLGGLILPFPFWPLGAVVSMFSRLWDIKDKTLAVIGPLLVTLAASVVSALFMGGGNVILVYFHAIHVGFGLLIRVGSVLTAAYLARRVTQGPRVKAPPWQRVTRGR